MRCGDIGSLVSSQADQDSQALGGTCHLLRETRSFKTLGLQWHGVDKTELWVQNNNNNTVLGKLDLPPCHFILFI